MVPGKIKSSTLNIFYLISALLLHHYTNFQCFHKSLASICIFLFLFNSASERKSQGISSQFLFVNPLACKGCFNVLMC